MRIHARVLLLLLWAACAGRARPVQQEVPYAGQGSAAAAEERPGLGTEWGETRSSRVSETAFARSSPRPWALVQLYYNDAQGLAAQVTHRGGPQLGPMTYRQEGVSVWLADEAGQVLPG